MALSWSFLAAGLLAGCGGGASPCSVRGMVTYQGKPIARGAIRFVAVEETEGTGGLAPIVRGKYHAETDGMCAGKYLVMISGFELTGRVLQIDENASIEEERQYIPAKYNSDSNERIELAPGENEHNFDLGT